MTLSRESKIVARCGQEGENAKDTWKGKELKEETPKLPSVNMIFKEDQIRTLGHKDKDTWTYN